MGTFKLIAKPVETFTLQEIDPKIEIKVRQATQIDVENLATLNEERTRQYERGGSIMTEISRFNWEEIKRAQVFATLAGCNITDEENEPLFRFSAGTMARLVDEVAFTFAWGNLPPKLANAIHRRVLKVNPTFGGIIDDEDSAEGE